MPLTIESPTIAQVLHGQFVLCFFFLAHGPLNRLAFLLFLVFSKNGDLQPVFKRFSWCFFFLIIFNWSSMLKVPCSPTVMQLLLSRISLLRRFLIISFLVVISDLRNSISFSRLVINFLSITVWYSSWLCKLIFCFTLFYIKFHISFFISGSRTSLFFCT